MYLAPNVYCTMWRYTFSIRGDLKLKRKKVILFLLLTVTALLAGCGKKSVKKEEAETIRVYLWTTNLYHKYSPYIFISFWMKMADFLILLRAVVSHFMMQVRLRIVLWIFPQQMRQVLSIIHISIIS